MYINIESLLRPGNHVLCQLHFNNERKRHIAQDGEVVILNRMLDGMWAVRVLG